MAMVVSLQEMLKVNTQSSCGAPFAMFTMKNSWLTTMLMSVMPLTALLGRLHLVTPWILALNTNDLTGVLGLKMLFHVILIIEFTASWKSALVSHFFQMHLLIVFYRIALEPEALNIFRILALVLPQLFQVYSQIVSFQGPGFYHSTAVWVAALNLKIFFDV